jgi:hypothetical protein
MLHGLPDHPPPLDGEDLSDETNHAPAVDQATLYDANISHHR